MPIPDLVPSQWETFDSTQTPPPFGHALKRYMPLDEDYVNLNPGSWGTLPLPVLFAATRLAYEIERIPDKLHWVKFQPLLNKARSSIARLVGAATDEVVFVPNATHALNTVLRNFEWREGDLLIGATTMYDTVANTILYLADRAEQQRPGAHFIEYNFPLSHAEIIAIFRSKLRQFKRQHSDRHFTDVPPLSRGYVEDPAKKQNKIVVVIDSISATPGVLMPWRDMVRICREEGVWSVVDAAHSIGQEPDINLGDIGPDFWITDCHKWLYAKRGCAVLYVPYRNHHVIKSSLPTGHEYVSPQRGEVKRDRTTFAKLHTWTGTADHTSFVTIPDALAFREWLGGEKVINDYCHKLALEGGRRLAIILGTRLMDETGELTLNMVIAVPHLCRTSQLMIIVLQTNVELPLPIEHAPGEIYSAERVDAINVYLREALLHKWKAYAAHYFHAGAWWCRCSVQVFNEMSDFEYLGEAINVVCREIREKILLERVSPNFPEPYPALAYL
ncbi:PLP-dependent transferase [Trametes punicea]|nr:PLP-dependent transferase [Trametes punicea]